LNVDAQTTAAAIVEQDLLRQKQDDDEDEDDDDDDDDDNDEHDDNDKNNDHDVKRNKRANGKERDLSRASTKRVQRAVEQDERAQLLGLRKRNNNKTKNSQSSSKNDTTTQAAPTPMTVDSLEADLAEQERLQELYKSELARMAKLLKESALAQSASVKTGNRMVDDVAESVDENKQRILDENARLEQHINAWKKGTFFYWFVLIFVLLVFIGMIIFMKIVPKVRN